jgi:hypothetical protein
VTNRSDSVCIASLFAGESLLNVAIAAVPLLAFPDLISGPHPSPQPAVRGECLASTQFPGAIFSNVTINTREKESLMKIRLILLIIATLIISSSVVNADTNNAKPSFSDIKNHWAEASINTMSERGVVTGFPDGTFRPNDRVTIEQFAVMMVRSLWEKGADGKLQWNATYLSWLLPMDRYYLDKSAFDLNNIPASKKYSEPYIIQLENMHLISRFADPIANKVDRPLNREALHT